ncbi:hypothetical protein ACSBL2_24475 [Pedobacter sp. AW31-3R]|uniref:hypothetical protein n=1 Tax=Pedobacter sp. AW31-3R TaxID=3445781 RepID=UPI003FA091FE
MQLHYGQIVEKVIRRNGYSITELARATQVNRRSVYNWFNQPHLKPDIIYRIGNGIKYDFSAEFPHLFGPQHFSRSMNTITTSSSADAEKILEAEMWKGKYVNLLEQYNSLLLSRLGKTTP